MQRGDRLELHGTVAGDGATIDRCCSHAKTRLGLFPVEDVPHSSCIDEHFERTNGRRGRSSVKKQQRDVNHETPPFLRNARVAEVPTYDGKYAILLQASFASTLTTIAKLRFKKNRIGGRYEEIHDRAGHSECGHAQRRKRAAGGGEIQRCATPVRFGYSVDGILCYSGQVVVCVFGEGRRNHSAPR